VSEAFLRTSDFFKNKPEKATLARSAECRREASKGAAGRREAPKDKNSVGTSKNIFDPIAHTSIRKRELAAVRSEAPKTPENWFCW